MSRALSAIIVGSIILWVLHDFTKVHVTAIHFLVVFAVPLILYWIRKF